MKKLMKIAAVIVLATGVGAGLSACSSVSTPTGMCGWIVGDGQDGRDAKITSTVYPDQKADYDTNTQVAEYVPCGPRNYIITDGSVAGLGDQTTPVSGSQTSEHTPVLVQVSAFWQLNQGKQALADFAELCNKYTCYTTKAVAGSSNFATPGWNGMLKENFSQAITDAMGDAMPQIDDSIWKTNDPVQKKKLNDLLSTAFMKEIRVRTGYDADLFCGSGNSGWSNPLKPGQGTFTCTNVRFDVTSVVAKSATTQNNASATNQTTLDTAANQSRYDKSVPLYGDQTHYWLGVQDAASKCPKGSTCNIYLGTPPQN